MKEVSKPWRKIQRRQFLKLSTGAGAAASLGVSSPAIAQGVKTFKFGHMMPANENLYHRGIVMFAEEVNKLSDKKLKVDVFPASQLGPIPEMLQSVQAGSQTFGLAVPAWYSNFF